MNASQQSVSSTVVEIAHLRKVYGSTVAVDDVTLTVPRGSSYGFLGRNGAGKTTTLRILLGLARPSGGSARILGEPVDRVRNRVGFAPDVASFYGWQRADEFLRFAGSLFGLGGKVLDERVGLLLEMAGLVGVKQPVGGFSRGMKQRLAIAQAMVNAPEVLILDEPTSALDPLGRKDVLDLVSALRGQTTVIFSTHILGDVERVCDEVAILDCGRVVSEAPLADLKQRYGSSLRFRLEADPDLREAVAAEPWCENITDTGEALVVAVSDADAAERRVPELVVAANARLKRFEPLETSLEDVFVELVGGNR